MKFYLKAMSVLFISFTFIGCAPSNHLSSYIRENGYIPLEPSRSNNALGAIVDFKAGHESMVAFPNECVFSERSNLLPMRPPENVGIPEIVEYADNKTIGNFSIPSELLKYVELGAQLNRNSSSKVRIVLKEPFTVRFSRKGIKKYLRENADNDCKQIFSDDENIVIHTILGAKSIEYTALNSKDREVSFDATILEKIKMNSKIDHSKSTDKKLVVGKTMYFGYLCWKADESSGFVGTPTFKEVSIEEIISRRR